MRAVAIIRDGDLSIGRPDYWEPCAPMTRDNVAIFRTDCATLTTYVRTDRSPHLSPRVNVSVYQLYWSHKSNIYMYSKSLVEMK